MLKGLGALVVILAAVGAIYGGCNKEISDEKLEKLIVNSLRKKLGDKGFPFKTVSAVCPEDVKVEKGNVFTCTATVDDHKLEIRAEQMDDDGSVSWEVTGGLEAMAIGYGAQSLVSDYIANNLGVEAPTVECPKKIALEKGGTFECNAMVDEVPLVATVEQQDDKGNVVFKITKGLIDSTVLAQELQKGLLNERGAVFKVDCGTSVFISKPGSQRECNGEAPDGSRARCS